MREILFRGKRKDCNAWETGYYSEYGFSDGRKHFINGFGYEVYPETVGQYTGLHDKNGAKIFEGDICRNTRTGEIVSVKWHGTMAGYVWSKRKENGFLFEFGELFRAYDKYEIIGNIHDNPELLEVSE